VRTRNSGEDAGSCDPDRSASPCISAYRADTNKAHIAFENVEELRQLIKLPFSQPSAYRCNSAISRACDEGARPVSGGGIHGSKFQDCEFLAVLSIRFCRTKTSGEVAFTTIARMTMSGAVAVTKRTAQAISRARLLLERAHGLRLERLEAKAVGLVFPMILAL